MRHTFLAWCAGANYAGQPAQEVAMANTELLARLDAAIAERNLLKHPFYQDWQAGKLSREALQLYAAQYYRHVEAFPKHLRVLAARTEGPLQGLIRENLAEEENPAGPQAVVQKFREICGDRPVAEAVAALYAYESQVPEIATTKIDGLRKFYGVTQPEGLAYFEVHEEADKAHRAAWRGWLKEHASGDKEEILKTTNEALDVLWVALDAVHCEKQEVMK